MKPQKSINVAVLLATYNGARFIEQQLRSLTSNDTPFTLHWLDDHSSDNTRDIVRKVTSSSKIALAEWHQSQHEGVPGAFFRLLECVDADIYLFCDQDDIWQAQKIDVTVQNLIADIDRPAIIFSDPLAFRDGAPEKCYRTLDIFGTTSEAALQESRAFMSVVGYGHTEGFTRALRDLFLKHKDVARSHALMHDLWMYNVALASGTARLLKDAPTTLYRRHTANASENSGGWRGKGRGYTTMTWHQYQWLRRHVARHARGFILAAATMPPGPKLEGLLENAKLLCTLDKRQSLFSLLRFTRKRVFWPNFRLAMGLAVACLLSAATE